MPNIKDLTSVQTSELSGLQNAIFPGNIDSSNVTTTRLLSAYQVINSVLSASRVHNIVANNYLSAGNDVFTVGLTATGDVLLGSSSVFYDSTQDALGIGVRNPVEKLTIAGNLSSTGTGYYGQGTKDSRSVIGPGWVSIGATGVDSNISLAVSNGVSALSATIDNGLFIGQLAPIEPNDLLSVAGQASFTGQVSSKGLIYDQSGNSSQWNSAVTQVNSNSGSWSSGSSPWISESSNVFWASAGNVGVGVNNSELTEKLTVAGNISAQGTLSADKIGDLREIEFYRGGSNSHPYKVSFDSNNFQITHFNDATLSTLTDLYSKVGQTVQLGVNTTNPNHEFTVKGTLSASDSIYIDQDSRVGGASAVGYPEWFGAKGDGATDDTHALTACIAQYPVTLLDAKTYMWRGGYIVPSNRYIKGKGMGLTTLKLVSGSPLSRTAGKYVLFNTNSSSFYENITWEDFTIDCNGENQNKNTTSGVVSGGAQAIWSVGQNLVARRIEVANMPHGTEGGETFHIIFDGGTSSTAQNAKDSHNNSTLKPNIIEGCVETQWVESSINENNLVTCFYASNGVGFSIGNVVTSTTNNNGIVRDCLVIGPSGGPINGDGDAYIYLDNSGNRIILQAFTGSKVYNNVAKNIDTGIYLDSWQTELDWHNNHFEKVISGGAFQMAGLGLSGSVVNKCHFYDNYVMTASAAPGASLGNQSVGFYLYDAGIGTGITNVNLGERQIIENISIRNNIIVNEGFTLGNNVDVGWWNGIRLQGNLKDHETWINPEIYNNIFSEGRQFGESNSQNRSIYLAGSDADDTESFLQRSYINNNRNYFGEPADIVQGTPFAGVTPVHSQKTELWLLSSDRVSYNAPYNTVVNQNSFMTIDMTNSSLSKVLTAYDSSVDTKLDIDISSNMAINFRNYNVSTDKMALTFIARNTKYWEIGKSQTTDSNGAGSFYIYEAHDGYAGTAFRILTGGDINNGGTGYITIDRSVAIGGGTPGERLTVRGNISARNDLRGERLDTTVNWNFITDSNKEFAIDSDFTWATYSGYFKGGNSIYYMLSTFHDWGSSQYDHFGVSKNTNDYPTMHLGKSGSGSSGIGGQINMFGRDGSYQILHYANKSVYNALFILANNTVDPYGEPAGGNTTMIFYSAGGETDANGYVGVGPITPNERLTVKDNISASGSIKSHVNLDSKSSDYVVIESDNCKVIEATGNITIGLPTNVSNGVQVSIVNVGTGVVTLSAPTLLSKSSNGVQLDKIAAQYAAATCYYKSGNLSWTAFGDLSAAGS